jgi:acyl-CoA thioester hydrolase
MKCGKNKSRGIVPAIHHQTFRVRYYECDAYGYLTNVNYLRWMQEAAFGASMAVGYDFAHYTELGHLWLVRETDIEYIEPLAYGDEVTVKTWVADIRRAHSLRRYEFVDTHTGQIAARASTDWVYINIETLRPAMLPEAMQLAFCPDGAPEADVPREHFPKLTPPPAAFTVRRPVEWRDIDTMWHVNNAVYLKYVEDADAHFFEVHGWPRQRMVEAGLGMVVRRYRIEYRQPAQMGDELEIVTWFSEVQGAIAVRNYVIQRAEDQALLARAQAHWMWVDTETAEPVDIPEKFLANFVDSS